MTEPLTAPGKVWLKWYGQPHPNDLCDAVYGSREANRRLHKVWAELFMEMEYEAFVADVLSDCDRVFGGTLN